MTQVATNAQPARSAIWIINQYAGSPRHGMEYRHYYLARQMAERGHRVVVISGSRSHLFTQPPQVSRPFTFELIDGPQKGRHLWARLNLQNSNETAVKPR